MVAHDHAETLQRAVGEPALQSADHLGLVEAGAAADAAEGSSAERNAALDRRHQCPFDRTRRRHVDRHGARLAAHAGASRKIEAQVDVVLGEQRQFDHRTRRRPPDLAQAAGQRQAVGGGRDEPQVPRMFARVVVIDRSGGADHGCDLGQMPGRYAQGRQRAGADAARRKHRPDTADRAARLQVCEPLAHPILIAAERSGDAQIGAGLQREVALVVVQQVPVEAIVVAGDDEAGRRHVDDRIGHDTHVRIQSARRAR